jgi:hypothetical protein
LKIGVVERRCVPVKISALNSQISFFTMVWKILSALSAVCLGTACYFAWANQKALVEERNREKYCHGQPRLRSRSIRTQAEAGQKEPRGASSPPPTKNSKPPRLSRG